MPPKSSRQEPSSQPRQARPPADTEVFRWNRGEIFLLGVVIALFITLRVHSDVPSEPFFNNDETRHVMSGVFVRDFLHDFPFQHPIQHASDYYAQYPALGFLIYPPLFYGIEGVTMLLFGIDFAVAKGLILCFAAFAMICTYVLARRTLGALAAGCSLLLLCFTPLFFGMSRQVMLDIPMLAWSMAALMWAVRYVDSGRSADLWLAALAASFALLTRYNAVLLIPLLLALPAAMGHPERYRRRALAFAGLAVVALVVPYYVLAGREIGWIHAKQQSVGVGDGTFLGRFPASLFDYITALPGQIGWPLLAFAALGIVVVAFGQRRRQYVPIFALILATYLTMTPASNRETRLVITWVPAFAIFAAEGAGLVMRGIGRPALGPLVASGIAGLTAWGTLQIPEHFVRGYAEAARRVIAESGTARFCLFEGGLDGNFIYQVRRQDPKRHLWVLRGDRVAYSITVQPSLGYRDWARSDSAMMDVVSRRDPAMIVVEEPPLMGATPAGVRLRKVFREHPERYRLEETIPIVMYLGHATPPTNLLLYRNLARRAKGPGEVEFEFGALRRTVKAVVSDSTGNRRDSLESTPSAGAPRR